MGVDGAAEGLRPSKLHEKKLKRQENKRGVVYISRIPPHLVRGVTSNTRGARGWPAVVSACRSRPLSLSCRLQKPQKLRQMLEEHAEIGRLYLAPEGTLCVAAARRLPGGVPSIHIVKRIMLLLLPLATSHCRRPRAAQEAQGKGRQQRQELHRGLGGV